VELPLTARKPVEVDVVATLPNGLPATLTGVQFALCGHGGPDADTVWLDGGFTAGDPGTGVGGVTLAGRDATDQTDALVLLTARAELWGLPVTGSTTVDPWFIDTIETP
jgi:hypothetical protein